MKINIPKSKDSKSLLVRNIIDKIYLCLTIKCFSTKIYCVDSLWVFVMKIIEEFVIMKKSINFT